MEGGLDEGGRDDEEEKKQKKMEKKESKKGTVKKLRQAIVSLCQTCFGTNEFHYKKSGI